MDNGALIPGKGKNFSFSRPLQIGSEIKQPTVLGILPPPSKAERRESMMSPLRIEVLV
jgi:hypothetical protein